MTQRGRGRRARRGRFGRRAFLAGAGCAALAGAAVLLGRGQTASASSVPPTDEAAPNAALPSGEWRAVWVSYLEWAGMDFSSEAAFRAGAAEQGYAVDFSETRFHHELYLSDPNRTAPEKLKTILRHPLKSSL